MNPIEGVYIKNCGRLKPDNEIMSWSGGMRPTKKPISGDSHVVIYSSATEVTSNTRTRRRTLICWRPRLVRKYAQIFFCTHYLYQNAKFSENETQGNCELRETNNDQGYIYEHTFSFETKLYTISLPFAAWDVQCSLVRLHQQTNMSLLQ